MTAGEKRFTLINGGFFGPDFVISFTKLRADFCKSGCGSGLRKRLRLVASSGMKSI